MAHGFCSSFRDRAAEETERPREVIEAAVAYAVWNKVQAAYALSSLFEHPLRLTTYRRVILRTRRRFPDHNV